MVDKQTLKQSNFSSGQLDGRMAARSETEVYQNGARSLQNMRVTLQGSAVTRPGFRFLQELGGPGWFTDFTFSEDQAYLLGFYDGRVVIYNSTGNEEYADLSGPWDATNFSELNVDRLGDTMVIVHRDFAPRLLVRTGATSFALETLTFVTDQRSGALKVPFLRYAPGDVTLTPNNVAGVGVTFTASAAYFTPAHVGVRIRYQGKQVVITGYVSPTEVTGEIIERFNNWRTVTIQAAVSPSGARATASDFALNEIVYGDATGSRGFLRASAGNLATVEMISGDSFDTSGGERIIGLSSGAEGEASTPSAGILPQATQDWDEQQWSDLRGWPDACVFRGSRLWLAGGALPGIGGSRTSFWFDFDASDGSPASSIQYFAYDSEVTDIRHMVAGQHLQVFTNEMEFYAPEDRREPLNPDNFKLLTDTSFGCSKRFKPMKYDGATLFTDSKGLAMREYRYSERAAGYGPVNLSALAGDITRGAVDGCVLEQAFGDPETVAVVCREDGTLACFLGDNELNLRSWVPWSVNGDVLSVASVNDALFICVERDGSWFLERQDSIGYNDSFCERTMADGVVGDLGYLAGSEVSITELVDGQPVFDLGSYTVPSSGVLDTGRDYAGKVVIGFPYLHEVETMPIEARDRMGSSELRPLTLVSLGVRVKSSLLFTANGVEWWGDSVERNLGSAPVARDTYLQVWAGDEEVGLDQTVKVSSTAGVPMEILGVAAEVKF